MAGENVTEAARPGRVTIPREEKFLVGRVEVAGIADAPFTSLRDMNIGQCDSIDTFEPCERCARDDQLCSKVISAIEQFNEWLNDEVLFVFDGFAREFPWNIND